MATHEHGETAIVALQVDDAALDGPSFIQCHADEFQWRCHGAVGAFLALAGQEGLEQDAGICCGRMSAYQDVRNDAAVTHPGSVRESR